MADRIVYKKIDYLLFLNMIMLILAGAFIVGVATREASETYETFREIMSLFKLKYSSLHLIWFASGLVLFAAAVFINYRHLCKFSMYFYIVVLALLGYVALEGNIAGGARSWILIGNYKLQPSEFAKLALILVLADTLGKYDDGIKTWKQFFPIAWKAAIPLGLVLSQPDAGTAMVIIVLIVAMLLVRGISWKLLIPLIILTFVFALIFWFYIMSEEQQARIFSFRNPEVDLLDSGYHLDRSLITIGSGRKFGKGIVTLRSLSQIQYLPTRHTDFIFAVLVETFGFVGGGVLIGLFGIFNILILRHAWKADDVRGALIVVGVSAMFMAHIFENIGMTMGVMPITGIPLPFISYGGSSMWTFMMACGLVINVGMREEEPMFE